MEIVKNFNPVKNKDIVKDDVEIFIKENLKDMLHILEDKRIPFLHAQQVGLDLNLFIWHYKDKWKLILNPSFIVLSKGRKDMKIKKDIQEASFSHITVDETPVQTKVFKTKRVSEVFAIYDEYTSEGQLKRGNINLCGGHAVAWQQMCDISEGKSIERFPEYNGGNDSE